MANVALTVRRDIIKNIEVSIGSSEEDENGNFQENGGSRFRPGTTGIARPFIADTTSNGQTQKTKGVPSTTDVRNKNLFTEKSLNLEIYENLRAPAKILDLRSLLINHNEDNIIFDLMGNNYEMFEVDQLSGKVQLCKFTDSQKLFLLNVILSNSEFWTSNHCYSFNLFLL